MTPTYKIVSLLVKILFVLSVLIYIFVFGKFSFLILPFFVFDCILALMVLLIHHFVSDANKLRALTICCVLIALLGVGFMLVPFGAGMGIQFIALAVLTYILARFSNWMLTSVISGWSGLSLSAFIVLAAGLIVLVPLFMDYSAFNEIMGSTRDSKVFSDIANSSGTIREKAFRLIAIAQAYESKCDQIESWNSRLTCYDYGKEYIDAMETIGQGDIGQDASLSSDICKTTYSEYYYVGGRFIKDGGYTYLKHIDSSLADVLGRPNAYPSWPKCINRANPLKNFDIDKSLDVDIIR